MAPWCSAGCWFAEVSYGMARDVLGKVDVVLLTKNSGKVLAKCLSSVYKNVPVRRLIVVDGFSRDNTLDVIQRFDDKYRNVKVLFDSGTRATARQRGIEAVETEWFLFVDSDVELCKDWFKKAVAEVDGDVGAVWGIEVWSTIRSKAMLKLFLLITRKIFELRGGTHDTLVRTSAVRDMKLPEHLHVFEDAYIKEWITKKGYKVVACYDPFCIHYRNEAVWTVRGSIAQIVDAAKSGSAKLLMKLLLAYGFYTAYAVSQILQRNRKADDCSKK
jgi:glycosyltransferase involved in cell wall biosynthesis